MQLFVASCSGRTVFKFTARQQSELHPPATALFSLLSCPSPTVLAIALAQWLRCKRQPHYIKHKTLKNRFELPFRLAFVRVDAYYAYAELLRKSKCSQSSQHDAQLLQIECELARIPSAFAGLQQQLDLLLSRQTLQA